MTILTIMDVTEICSLRLVQEGKTGKEIPESSRLEFVEKFLAKNFAWSDTEGNTSWPLNRGGLADLPFLRTLLAICQKSWELQELFCHDYKPVFTLDSEDLSFLYKQKKWFLWTMAAAAEAAENQGDEWGMTWYFWSRIYSSFPT